MEGIIRRYPMIQKLHKNARTSYYIRKYIRESSSTVAALAVELNLNEKTIRKWRGRESVADVSSRPQNLQTKVTREEEEMIVYERKAHKKTVFEIWDTLCTEIPNLYPMKIYRILVRWGLQVLPPEITRADRQIKKFRKYSIGYVHIDLIYTPKLSLPTGKKRYYVFSAIDRVSKLAYTMVSERKTKEQGEEFLRNVLSYYPYPIHYILTDNGKEFTYKSLPKKKQTKKIHPFDSLCKKNHIQHRLTKFHHPWTNGMVERFNRKLRVNVVRRHLFEDRTHLEQELLTYTNKYNFVIKLQGLNGCTPVEFLIKNHSSKLLKPPQRIVS